VAPTSVYLYVLVAPDGEIRYVGQTVQSPAARLRQHLCEGKKKGRSAVQRWIWSLLRKGQRPVMRVFQTLPASCYNTAEVYWIDHFKGVGCRLLNLTAGGEGSLGCVPTEEARRKNREWHLGRAHTVATRAKMGQARLGVYHTAEHRAKTSQGRGGRAVIDGNGVVYLYTSAAARALGLRPNAISEVLSGKHGHVHGYTFRYA
jgi:DNA endonuclease I-HmuI-like, NUMOD-like domain/GIY-YIG catalytic domain